MELIVDRRLSEDGAIWLEVLSRHRDVAARYRLSDGEMTVGRGYDNDVILDDPYVAPRHLRIVRDETGHWIAEDLGSANGLFAERGKRRQSRVVLDDDSVVRIGQTFLRLRRSSHTVAPERVLQHAGRALGVALVLGVIALALTALTLWLGETAEPKLSGYLVPLLSLPLAVLAWSGIWAILTKIFSGQARFERHLLIAVSAVLASWVIEQGGEFLVFAASWPSVATYGYVAVWLLSAIVIFLHLRVIGPSRLRLKGGLVAALMLVGIAIQSVSLFDGRDRQTRQETALLPPGLRLAPMQSDASFFTAVAGLRAQLDEDRKKAAEESADFDEDEDSDD